MRPVELGPTIRIMVRDRRDDLWLGFEENDLNHGPKGGCGSDRAPFWSTNGFDTNSCVQKETHGT